MSRISLAMLAFGLLAGCSTASSTRIFVISPSVHDWETAFSRLQPEEQSAVREGSIAVDASPVEVEDNLYRFGYGPPEGRPIKYEKLGLSTTCVTYNELYASHSTNRWKLASAVIFSGFGAENELPVYSYTYEVHFQLTSSDRTLTVSGKGTGPAISGTRSSDDAKAADNQAFAFAFLKLIVALRQVEQGG